jgi:hypothetical protein
MVQQGRCPVMMLQGHMAKLIYTVPDVGVVMEFIKFNVYRLSPLLA